MKKLLIAISLVTTLGCSHDNDDNSFTEVRDFTYVDFLKAYHSISKNKLNTFFYQGVLLKDNISKDEIDSFTIFLNQSIEECIENTIQFNNQVEKVEEPILLLKHIPYPLNIEECY